MGQVMGHKVRWGVGVLAALTLVLAACGGGGSDGGSEQGSSSNGSSSNGSSSNSESNSGSSSSNGSGDGELDLGDVLSGDLEECVGLSGALASVSMLGLSNVPGMGNEVNEDEVNDAVNELEQYIPAELEDAFNTIRDSLNDGAGFDDPDVEAAFDEVEAYFDENCADLGNNN